MKGNFMSRLFIIIGKSASGKDTAQKKLVDKYGFTPLVLYTTRPKRDNEKRGVDYHFVTDEEFNQLIEDDQFIYHATFHAYEKDGGELQSWQYGLRKRRLNGDTVVVTDIDNVEAVRDYYEGRGDEVTVIMLEVVLEERESRARERQGDKFSLDEWIRRTIDEFNCYSSDKVYALSDVIIDNTEQNAIDMYMDGE
jgi:guanylate kinase